MALRLSGRAKLTQAMRFIRFILNKGLSLDVFFYITSLLLPAFILITLPVSLFFATLFTLNKLTNDRELIVLRSSGLSDWQALVRARTTLVIYMGLRNLQKIVAELAAAGMDLRTPACVVENGTLGSQRQVITRLGALSSAGFRGPALIVIGAVVGLANVMIPQKARAA